MYHVIKMLSILFYLIFNIKKIKKFKKTLYKAKIKCYYTLHVMQKKRASQNVSLNE